MSKIKNFFKGIKSDISEVADDASNSLDNAKGLMGSLKETFNLENLKKIKDAEEFNQSRMLIVFIIIASMIISTVLIISTLAN